MSEKEEKLKDLIRKYILDIGGLLKEEMDDPKLEFGFRFLYPHQKGREFIAARAKKKDFIEISCGTPLSPSHKEKFNALEESDKRHFARKLVKEFYRRDIDFMYKLSKEYVIVIMDKIFLNQQLISKNDFFRTIRRIYYATMGMIIQIQDYFSDEYYPEDFTIDKK